MSREFRPCGHSALGCYNSAGACCKECDHPTYWRSLDMQSTTRRPIETVNLPEPTRELRDPVEVVASHLIEEK